MNGTRRAAASAGRHVGILADLRGVKLRTSTCPGGQCTLERGQTILLAAGDGPSDARRLYISPPAALAALGCSHRVFIDDGRIQVQVTGGNPRDGWQGEVTVGGILGDRKGVNLPDTPMPNLPALTSKDYQDIAWGVCTGVDLFALSFVRSAEDVAAANRAIAELGADTPVIAKLEKPQVIQHLDAIIAESYGVMLARGDLGVEIRLSQLPVVQKRIITTAREHRRPVITATQMLESMVSAPTPTRAEVSDVANAVFDGTDAVMLSAETSVGAYPVEAVRTMREVIAAAEADPGYTRQFAPLQNVCAQFVDAIGEVACRAAERVDARCIAVYTQNGKAAIRIAGNRPTTPIVAFSENATTLRRLALVWGVEARLLERAPGVGDDFVPTGERILRESGLVASGDAIAVVSKTFFEEGDWRTSCLLLHQLK